MFAQKPKVPPNRYTNNELRSYCIPLDNIDGPDGNCAISGYDIDTARQDTLFVFILFHTSQKKQNHEKTQSLKNATTFCRIDYIIAATCRRRWRLLRYLLLAFLNLGCICVDQISNQINKKKRHLVASISTNQKMLSKSLLFNQISNSVLPFESLLKGSKDQSWLRRRCQLTVRHKFCGLLIIYKLYQLQRTL